MPTPTPGCAVSPQGLCRLVARPAIKPCVPFVSRDKKGPARAVCRWSPQEIKGPKELERTKKGKRKRSKEEREKKERKFGHHFVSFMRHFRRFSSDLAALCGRGYLQCHQSWIPPSLPSFSFICQKLPARLPAPPKECFDCAELIERWR